MTPAETRAAIDATIGADNRRALSAKLRELGLKIVPVEATEEMVSMGTSAVIFGIGKPVDDAAVPRVWSAMVDACEDVLG